MTAEDTFEERELACHLLLVSRFAVRAEDEAHVAQESLEQFREIAHEFHASFSTDRSADPRALLMAFGEVQLAVERLAGDVAQIEDHLGQVPIRVGSAAASGTRPLGERG